MTFPLVNDNTEFFNSSYQSELLYQGMNYLGSHAV